MSALVGQRPAYFHDAFSEAARRFVLALIVLCAGVLPLSTVVHSKEQCLASIGSVLLYEATFIHTYTEYGSGWGSEQDASVS